MSTLYELVEWEAGDPVNFTRLDNMDQGIRRVRPVGDLAWSFADSMAGFLKLDGATVARATYPELWDWIVAEDLVGSGKPFGVGDGSTTFDLLDARGLFMRGTPAGSDPGETGGAATHVHLNPATGQAGGHSHSNPNVNANGNHSHTNPNTNAGGAHSHGGGQTGGVIGLIGGGSMTHTGSTDHVHTIEAVGQHVHSQLATGTDGSHSHSQGDTGSVPNHSHAQGATEPESNLPPFFNVNVFIAT